MNIYIIRNNQRFGPYTESFLLSYVNQGQVLLQDRALKDGDLQEHTVGYYLKQAKLKRKVANNGNLFFQLKMIGTELIFPKTTMFSKAFLIDQRFLILAMVGLLPMIILQIPFRGFLLFYGVALYFSIMWGLFFYACFKTQQVRLKTTLLVFFLTQILIFSLWSAGLPLLNPFYALVDKPMPINIVGYTLGVGITEELAKMLPLLFILKRTKEPLVPQTMVFYGLMSGIAFGVYEGVEYQMGVNAELPYDVSFFVNILRLTSLPFLHACWCGIAGYFLSFAHLYPLYRRGLYTLSIVIPTAIHGLYDSFAVFPIVPLIFVFIGLMLLMVYLKQGVNYQSKLRNNGTQGTKKI